ncbi:hypothetical protein MJI67_24745, partial [Salmonella enterica subsp. enterica serovar Cerro]|nr:hypothetical protein [Salmonella enterica subsp. enterica serovar Cerro]
LFFSSTSPRLLRQQLKTAPVMPLLTQRRAAVRVALLTRRQRHPQPLITYLADGVVILFPRRTDNITLRRSAFESVVAVFRKTVS